MEPLQTIGQRSGKSFGEHLSSRPRAWVELRIGRNPRGRWRPCDGGICSSEGEEGASDGCRQNGESTDGVEGEEAGD